ncbi:tRNA (N6-threonylcarbamoyladenosine(37)-N6)-methyltransferase TrmO [Arsenophonus nasoniae]|uniref:tRNA (adenine(37)-N6)-methyltransferase n=1 Tax=Arsenophonus nasoniae TaxID=638 RepID=A0A4P7KUE7_9GAMM|nr:tRNA (N6-threonylcarbamoyladenosine(37)-N6)-methyltransferase TrmO [Arsenophonus nasoniae]QBY42100.1 tRNA (adenine(37)-N6)-methyltransferase [Arsenophonus nasoniae]WGM02048.1 tRNA (N6-threonylcarbamoyladenosine(37)-N6)-methyltransferase TrmO [Arsenophonus nasoniae]WGM06276.1 tRNA (N6-threonylcarbamoyladenosine(37)-N6)-methyltransferase TrmO [Arsenophonus nasoniae]WGM11213.1 tRNA (N6-threonylcarbamoyladenosine(37)-N6)-methyltransferase TrmO [Arsenophonus nasoniae]WGM15914.1 tRNA (N6-threonyl
MNNFQFNVIGLIESPYKEKFAIPRQPGLIDDGQGFLRLLPPYNHPDAVRGLEQFSHIWVIFIFHQTKQQSWRPLVRPPRLGGNTKMGVFATRSPFRPNPIGMSLIELKNLIIRDSEVGLTLGSIDLVDGTPVIDIKPYLPFAESLPKAVAGFAQAAPANKMTVIFSATAQKQLIEQQTRYSFLERFIRQVLAQDPRPAYKKNAADEKIYAVHLLDFNVRWRISANIVVVLSLDTLKN